MRGWNLRIFAIDLYCAVDNGNITSLINTTRPTIAQPQLPSRPCSLASTQNSQPARVAIGLKLLKSTARSSPGTCCDWMLATSLGPTHSRAVVVALVPGATLKLGPLDSIT